MADDPTLPAAPMATTVGDDQPVDDAADALTVLKAIQEYKKEAETAKRTRMQKNKTNRRVYLGDIDWSHKQKGQSREHLPKLQNAVEQFGAFVKRSLVAFGDWFDVQVPPGPLSSNDVRKLILAKLDWIAHRDHRHTDFATLMSDGIKSGALDSLITLKVHGRHFTESTYTVERELSLGEVNGVAAPVVTHRLTRAEVTTWQPVIELVRDQDYFPDPTGEWLYEIHEVERDLSDVLAWAEAGRYDREAVEKIQDDATKMDEASERARSAGQDPATPPGFRKKVVIAELWGTLLDSTGHTVQRNCVAAMANDTYLIRAPVDNWFWHNESPFVSFPLIRVPFSVWHKALADNGALLNLAENELFNLILDGGFASVWGTRQLRTDYLEDPKQVAEGIPQGMTLQIKAETPEGMKVLETVTTGEVPRDAMAVLASLDKEFLASMFTNELRVGFLPPKETKATEVVEASQSAAVTLDAIARDVEKYIARVLRLFWLNLLQFADDLDADEIVAAIGPAAALALVRMSPAERYARYAGASEFRVFGISALLARAREFQKLAAVLSMAVANPVLLQVFMREYSPSKTFAAMLKMLNLDPDNLRITADEQATLGQRFKEMPFFQQMTGGMTGGKAAGGVDATQIGESNLPAEIAQQQTNGAASLGM